MKHRLVAKLIFGATLSLCAPAWSHADGAKAYVGLFKDNAVGVIDTATDHVLHTIPIASGPHGLVATPDGSTVFASSDADSVVSVIDTATDKVTGVIDVGKATHGLAITPDGKIVLVAGFGTSSVLFVDVARRSVVGRAPVADPHNVAVTPDGQTAYVASQRKGSFALVILDVATMSRKGTVSLDKMPRAIGISPADTKLYLTLAGSNAVQVIDTRSNSIVAQIPVGAAPHHPLFSPDGKTALVVSQGPGVLSLIDTATDTVRASVKVGELPHWIALTPDGRAYVSNEGSNDVSVVNLATMKVLANIPVGDAPRKMVITGAKELGIVTTGISSFAFENDISITAGQAVRWINDDAVPHTVTGDDGSWDSGDIAPGSDYTKTFAVAGKFQYHCTIHPSMTGTIVVKERM